MEEKKKTTPSQYLVFSLPSTANSMMHNTCTEKKGEDWLGVQRSRLCVKVTGQHIYNTLTQTHSHTSSSHSCTK